VAVVAAVGAAVGAAAAAACSRLRVRWWWLMGVVIPWAGVRSYDGGGL